MMTTKRMRKSDQAGLSLLELLIAMAIMGVLMLAFTQLFGGSLKASSSISARNELLSEGQIAQQLVVSKLKQASFIYPTDTTFQMTNTVRTRNTINEGRGQFWRVGSDPIIAMIVPPQGSDNPNVNSCLPPNPANRGPQHSADMCFTFYAYYPIKRSIFIAGVDADSAPVPDPANDDAWLLMEYRENVPDGVDRSSNRLAGFPDSNTVLNNLRGVGARILVDYVQPPENGDPPLFNLNANGSIEFNLQMGRNQGGKMLELPPLGVRAYPRNAP